MTDIVEHEGHTNRATWLVSLWLANDAMLYGASRDLARTWDPKTGFDLAGALEDLTREESAADVMGGFRGDLMGESLRQVDWVAIATDILAEVREA